MSSYKERADEDLQDASKREGEEENGWQGGRGDPAVLAMGPVRPMLKYTRDTLMRLRNSPLVTRDLDDAFIGNDNLTLVMKKRSDSPNEEDRGGRGDAPNENHKGVYTAVRGDRERRPADPRERVRKESEPSGGGIVLSPQRRSFTSGCVAPAGAAAPPTVARTRPESPLSAAPAAPPLSSAKTEQGGRRIGSGRLPVRDMTTAPWEREETTEREYREPYRPPAERVIPRNNSDRYERRSFNRDSYSSDIKREREDRFNNEKIRDNRDENRRSGGGRFTSRRYEKEDEPEWFSGGPTSQLETIELRGFDDPPKRNGTMADSKHGEKWSGGSRSPTERWREPPARSSPAPPDTPPPAPSVADQPNNINNDHNEKEPSKPAEEPVTPADHNEFNFDDFLKLEAIPDMLTNGNADGECSRFRRFFSPSSNYDRMPHNMEEEKEIGLPPEPAHVFAPISPAAGPRPAGHPSLLELLRRANAAADQPQAPPDNMGSVGGKMHSLEELEARLRAQNHNPAPPPQMQPDKDISAFQRLLAQVSGGHVVPAEPQPQPRPQQPMSLLQMLHKSMELQKAPQPPHIPQELLYKLLHVQRQQQEMQNSMSGAAGPAPPERDLLQRPEAVALIQGLKSGEFTVQHLMQQLNNPGLQSRHRDMLQAVLRLHHNRQMAGSPLPGSVPPPHLVVPPHHQPLRLSPIPHAAFCVSPIMATSPNALSVHHPGVTSRIPSPRELAAHTQNIMQNALIKKKLEEQRENYRRRTEQMQIPKQATPISFTPTSVLRKMTAEKEVDLPSPKQGWNHLPKMPQGRPIVKGNQSGVPQPMGYASPSEYQHYINSQQQQMPSGRPFPQMQQRQPQPPMTNINMNMNMTRGVPAGTTIQQLMAQSQQRTLNDIGGVQARAGGGDNQLARWFSPELLARASAGKLPSVNMSNVLSLEELERHHSPAVRN